TGPQAVTVEDSMSMVHLSSGINPPASDQLLSEPAIVAHLASATLGVRSKVPWLWLVGDYDRIRDLVAKTFDDFHDFNARVRVPGGFRLSNTARDRIWNTPSGRANFIAAEVPTDNPSHRARRAHGTRPASTLATTRSHDQSNTTAHGPNDRYRGVFGERRVLFIHADDIAALGMKAGDWVDLESLCDDGVKRTAKRFLLVEYDIPQGCLAAYYPETNPLVPLSSFADESRTPTSKSVPVLVASHVPDTTRATHARGIPALGRSCCLCRLAACATGRGAERRVAAAHAGVDRRGGNRRRARRGLGSHRGRRRAHAGAADARRLAAGSREGMRWRKGVGVEPTQDRLAAPTGFEVRPPHRGRCPSKA